MHFYLEWDQKRIRVFSIWKLLFRTISEKSIPEFMSIYLLESSFTFFFSFLCWPRCTACRILVPPPETEPGPQQWKYRVLTTGLPGNSLGRSFKLTWKRTLEDKTYYFLKIKHDFTSCKTELLYSDAKCNVFKHLYCVIKTLNICGLSGKSILPKAQIYLSSLQFDVTSL